MEMKREVLSIKLLKLLVLLSIPLIVMLVPSANLFKYDKFMFFSFGINFILYFTKEPGIIKFVFCNVLIYKRTREPNVAKENILSGSFFIIPLITTSVSPKLSVSPKFRLS